MSQPVLPAFPLRSARVHEVCGPSAMVFAAIASVAVRGEAERGPMLWVREGWQSDTLCPQGLAPFRSPDTLLMAASANQTDSLAVAEEALRDGIVPFVAVEITHPLNLREGRRLQLAALAGGTTGLCLIPEGMGSNAAETRWHVAPRLAGMGEGADSTPMRWQLIKNKSGTCGAWNVRWDATAHRLDVVSPTGE